MENLQELKKELETLYVETENEINKVKESLVKVYSQLTTFKVDFNDIRFEGQDYFTKEDTIRFDIVLVDNNGEYILGFRDIMAYCTPTHLKINHGCYGDYTSQDKDIVNLIYTIAFTWQKEKDIVKAIWKDFNKDIFIKRDKIKYAIDRIEREQKETKRKQAIEQLTHKIKESRYFYLEGMGYCRIDKITPKRCYYTRLVKDYYDENKYHEQKQKIWELDNLLNCLNYEKNHGELLNEIPNNIIIMKW